MNREIKLTKGFVAIVDEEDYEELNKYKWTTAKGYAVRGKYSPITQRTTHIFMHRVIMNPPDNMDIDHINHNRHDNRRKNLRICTRSDNQVNRGRSPTRNTSGYKGVSWSKFHRKWDARIKKDGKSYWLGLFVDIVDANLAYQQKARELFGEFNYYK